MGGREEGSGTMILDNGMVELRRTKLNGNRGRSRKRRGAGVLRDRRAGHGGQESRAGLGLLNIHDGKLGCECRAGGLRAVVGGGGGKGWRRPAGPVLAITSTPTTTAGVGGVTTKLGV